MHFLIRVWKFAKRTLPASYFNRVLSRSYYFIIVPERELVYVTQADGSTSFGPPSRRKSVHLYTFPLYGGTQDSDILTISEVSSSRSHTLTCDNIPWKEALFLKPPPTWSWSCPSTKVPLFLIAWPVIKPSLTSCSIQPSFATTHNPMDPNHVTQMWCHAPSWAVTFVLLQWNKNDTTNRWAARRYFFGNKFLSPTMDVVFLYWNPRMDKGSNESRLREHSVCKAKFAFLVLIIRAFLLENSEK